MAIITTDNKNYTDIADAIRTKNGTTTQYKPSEMANAISAIESGGGGGDFEPTEFTGDLNYFDYAGTWDKIIEKHKDKITTKNISNFREAFLSSKLEEIPITFNFDASNDYVSTQSCFSSCSNLKKVPEMVGLKLYFPQRMFQYCYKIRDLGSFETADTSGLHSKTSIISYMFYGCYSLRRIDSNFLKNLYSGAGGSINNFVWSLGFEECHSLDEIVGLSFSPNQTITSNTFSYAFEGCDRLKDIIFDTDNGAPKVAKWKTQTIDLTQGIGYAKNGVQYILNYNSGITREKEVRNDESYQLLKNDPDWYAGPSAIAYSRYNHDSAVRTINSLPDTSAYIAANSGTNTIKFKGNSGSATDGGAISNLTEEEIAVATAKGWTVTLV